MRSFNTPFVYVSVLLSTGTSGARSSLWWVPSPCEVDIRWPSWQEQYYIQLPFSRGQLIYVCRLNICLCVCSSVPDPRVWPHQTQLSTLYIHVFFPLSAFFSPFIFFPWIPPSRILPLKITCIEPHLIHFNLPPPPVSSDPFPAEKIEGKPLLRQKTACSTLDVLNITLWWMRRCGVVMVPLVEHVKITKLHI